jgi:hypothetical protein
MLIAELAPLTQQVETRLKKASLAARAVVVKLKYQDFRVITLRREAEKLLGQLTLETGVRLLGVGAEGLVNAADTAPVQALLFPLHT